MWVCVSVVVAACSPVTDPDGGGGGEDAGIEDDFDAAPGMQILSVERGGDGAGVVRSSPEGIDCGQVCRAEFPEGSTVTLAALAAGDANFAGWTGACRGRGACEIALDTETSAGATFDASGVTRKGEPLGGDLADQLEHIAVDAMGNVIVAGTFHGTMMIGDTEVASFYEEGAVQSVFVAKLDPAGELQWAQAIWGAGDVAVAGLATDADGHVYVVGDYTGSLGIEQCANQGGQDVFHYKLARDDGRLMWSNCYGGTSMDRASAAVVDAAGTLWVAHFFKGSTSFGGDEIASLGGDDVVVSRYDAVGDHLGSVRYGGAAGDEQITDLAADPGGDVVAVGSVVGDVPFDGADVGVTSRGGYDAVVVRFAPTGAVRWVRGWGGSGRDGAGAVAIDADGDLIVTASFAAGEAGSATFGGDEFRNEDASADLVVAKYEGATGDHLWSVSLAATGFSSIRGLALDDGGDPIAVGFVTNVMDFGGGPVGTDAVRSVFAAELAGEDGSHHWARAYCASGNSCVGQAAAHSPAADALFIGGGFQGRVDFGDETVLTSTTTDARDAFLLRLVP